MRFQFEFTQLQLSPGSGDRLPDFITIKSYWCMIRCKSLQLNMHNTIDPGSPQHVSVCTQSRYLPRESHVSISDTRLPSHGWHHAACVGLLGKKDVDRTVQFIRTSPRAFGICTKNSGGRITDNLLRARRAFSPMAARSFCSSFVRRISGARASTY